jgi:hypothetical protein
MQRHIPEDRNIIGALRTSDLSHVFFLSEEIISGRKPVVEVNTCSVMEVEV